QETHRLERIHHHKRNPECSYCNSKAADRLSLQHRESAAIEKSGQRRRVVGASGASQAILTRSKKAERQRSPDATEAVNRNRADRIVNTKPFQHLGTQDNKHPRASAKKACAGRTNPLTRT